MLTKKLINKYNPPRIKYYLVFNTIKTYKKKGKINYQHGSKHSLILKYYIQCNLLKIQLTLKINRIMISNKIRIKTWPQINGSHASRRRNNI